jgi:hypothetical protein
VEGLEMLRGHEITEFVRWQRVGPIFFALLFVLLLLWSFWNIGPKFVSNIGKLIDTITASPKLGSWIEDVEKNYQFFVFLLSMFAICMGLSRWLGKRLWYQGTISRRKELKLPVASLFSSDPSSFNYSSLFQGGLIGLAIVSYQFVFVFASPGADENVLQRLPLAMFLPIVLLAQQSLQLFLVSIFSRQGVHTLTHSFLLIISSTFLIGILVISFLVEAALLSDEKNIGLPVQIILTVIVSVCYSYAYGVSEGLKAADPDSTYPLVSIKVIEGADFDEAWLYERTDSDYRIVTKSGSNHIIPASNVKEIKGL